MKILVDADACPVVDTIIEEVEPYQLPVTLVRSYNHFSMQMYPSFVTVSYVDSGADAADYKIVQLSTPGDIIVTQDYGLAALGLEQGCTVIHHSGFIYKSERIDQMLQERHINAKARKAGHRTKGPKKLTAEQKMSFRKTLRKLLQDYTY
ncbi:hypothetical protein J416_04628 [Gracilibacillus halophilus YIM-C55.5]|uniref:UPF0178 protein J416_04628 n=1 Tax=Gracilibacillus halophilus YIM-C55.5 TaxID=1308866 RepID=N4WDC2_9BACI|nr:YaiI/YqxD family protein [Gracilibacillus halophilus]ENH97274.1 hypothetical protein J416_04628 [Gracilibacillus halophilus YIM-C55.5]